MHKHAPVPLLAMQEKERLGKELSQAQTTISNLMQQVSNQGTFTAIGGCGRKPRASFTCAALVLFGGAAPSFPRLPAALRTRGTWWIVLDRCCVGMCVLFQTSTRSL